MLNKVFFLLIGLINLFFLPNAIATCTIISLNLQSGDDVVCSGDITNENYEITKNNVTFTNEAVWTFDGNILSSNYSSIIGGSNINNSDISNLKIINNGSIVWKNAFGNNDVAGNKFVIALGQDSSLLSSNINITNNGIIEIETNPSISAYSVEAIAQIVSSGNSIQTNNGTINITSSNATYIYGMNIRGGTNVEQSNLGEITITNTSNNYNFISGMVYTNKNNYSSPSNIYIKNEGNISVSGSISYGIFLESANDKIYSASVIIENTGTILTYSPSYQSGAIMLFDLNTINSPIIIKNSGTLSGYYALFATPTSISNIEFYNTGDATGYILTGAGDDYIELSSGTFNGGIYTRNGNDTLVISGGTVTSSGVNLGEGEDIFIFSGGSFSGILTMGDDDDKAFIYSSADLSGTLQLDGGAGTDSLTFNGVTLNAYTDDSSSPSNDLAKGVNLSTWEEINLVSSLLTLKGDLFSESNVGELNIDSSSYLYTDIVSATIYGDVNNSGNIDLSNNNSAGDTLTIDGNYVGNGGDLVLNTVLGDDNSTTDKLVITGNASGTTYVAVKNLGGSGAATVEGIQIVEVDGTSTSNAFSKSGRIVAGSYEYSVTQGNTSGTDTNSWYLTSKYIDNGGTKTDTSVIRPEAGTYIANLASANTLFNTTLHDRLGETQYTDLLTGEKLVTSMWIRSQVGQNRFAAGHGQLKNKTNWSLVQLGGDIVQWSSNDTNRLHLGVMAGYGRSSSDTDARLSGYSAKGSIDGYSLGLYGTWYDNDADKTGLYVDNWVQWNHFNAKVHGQELSREKYKLKGITASIESGYTFKLGGSELYNYWLQPKAQVTYMGVDADNHRESNGTKIKADANNWQSRLGVRLSANTNNLFNSKNSSAGQLFIEANWLHNTQPFNVKMDDSRISQDGARNIAEIKTGVEANILANTNAWFNLAYQRGDNSYRNLGAMLGVKYSF